MAIGLGIAAVFTAAGLVGAETTMDMGSGDRRSAVVFFAAIGLVAAIGVGILPTLARRLSLRAAVLLAVLVGPMLVVAATLIGAWTMFLSSHDTQLLVLLVLAGLASGLVAAGAIVVPLYRDLNRVRAAIEHVAEGDLDVRTGVQRSDEIGTLAAAVDRMAARLAEAEARRTAAEHERKLVLASVSHDLRTPLTALRAALEAVQDGISPDPDRYLASMHHDLAAVDALVDDLFLLGRLEAGRYEVTRVALQLGEVVDEAVEALTPLARRAGVRLRADLGDCEQVHGGHQELSRVVRNLLDNAIRHAPPGSEVVVALQRDGGWPTVRVLDQGPGFADELRVAAFQRFRRADDARTRAGGGAGLGLAIARGLVEAHGGRIWADAGPGGKVVFRLPPAVVRNPGPSGRLATGQSLSSSGATGQSERNRS